MQGMESGGRRRLIQAEEPEFIFQHFSGYGFDEKIVAAFDEHFGQGMAGREHEQPGLGQRGVGAHGFDEGMADHLGVFPINENEIEGSLQLELAESLVFGGCFMDIGRELREIRRQYPPPHAGVIND
jgi:hypothetical protein